MLTFGITARPTLAAAVAAGRLRALPWSTRGALARLGVATLDELIGAQVLVHGSLGWGEREQRDADRLGLDNRACGQVVAMARVAGFAAFSGGAVDVRGEQPSWAASLEQLHDERPDDASTIVLLDDVDEVEPTAALGTLSGPWMAPSAITGRVRVLGRVVGVPAGRSSSHPSAASPAAPALTLEQALAAELDNAALALADVDEWRIADVLPRFADTWITEVYPVVAKGSPAPAPAFTIERQADPVAQAREIVTSIAARCAWWSTTLPRLVEARPAPAPVIACEYCEAPSALRPLRGEVQLIEGAGFVAELGRRIGTVCSRRRGKGGGCQPLVIEPVVCSTDCERRALAAAGRPVTTATTPDDVDWRRALQQRRLWVAAGWAQAHAVRRNILINLGAGAPLPTFEEG